MLVEFLIPTYNRVEPLHSMLTSLLAQTDKDWKATVIVDGPISEMHWRMASQYYGESNITFTNTETKYNDYGHTPREIFKQKSEADYLVMTGDDNYYTPNFVAELRKATKGQPGFIYWDMVHSHFDYACFKCVPAHGQIDMGAFATRIDLAKQIKMNTGFAADGDFVEDFNKKFPLERKIKINKVLFIHN